MRPHQCILSLAIALVPAAAFAQIPAATATPKPSPSAAEIVETTREKAREYTDTFKNLVADETKRFVMFDKKGVEKKTRVIRSSLLIYQPADETAPAGEFRNIIDVDGKPIENADKRIASFFEKVIKSGAAAKELEEIRQESTRHDLGIAVSGFTLNQSVALWNELRPVMKFEIVGSKSIDGHSVIELAYRQTADTDLISVNGAGDRSRSAHSQQYEIDPDGKKVTVSRLSGTLWVDALTFRLRRERRVLAIQIDGSAPKTVVEQEFDYSDSDFGILTPKRISHLQYRLNGKTGEVSRDVLVVFEYGKFSKPDVEVTSSDVKKD